ncbi:uncharacterized protein LOC132277827 [Cornus florida]|uniref:uncharacterized protein LOC132277827 n=1 Tax=Cornus florida TaxID=4283 RepID=UPI002897F769|nr:uncharacterized protein LOC132277827 [Cornus florida]
MIQNLGFHWASNGESFTTQSSRELPIERIKNDLSDSYPKFTEMINSSSDVEDFKLDPTSYTKVHDQNCASNLGSVSTPIKVKSQIFPTVNISNSNQLASSISSPLDSNLQALDLFSSARIYGNLREPSYDDFGLFEESISYDDDADHMQQSSHRPSNFPCKISPFANGVAEAKRPGNFLEPKASQAGVKKSRLEEMLIMCTLQGQKRQIKRQNCSSSTVGSTFWQGSVFAPPYHNPRLLAS